MRERGRIWKGHLLDEKGGIFREGGVFSGMVEYSC